MASDNTTTAAPAAAQPEALRLAEKLERYGALHHELAAAAELRRLHALTAAPAAQEAEPVAPIVADHATRVLAAALIRLDEAYRHNADEIADRPQWMEDALEVARSVPRPQADAGAVPAAHPDDIAVDRFAAAMKDKLAAARAKGRGGWETAECTQERLSTMLREHVEKGDPRDVANFCMFLWARGEAIAAAPQAPAAATCQPVAWRYSIGIGKWAATTDEASAWSASFDRRVDALGIIETLSAPGTPAPAAATESVLIDGVAYSVPAAVAGELLRLHMEALAAPAAAVAPAEGAADSIATAVCLQVAELPDRNSPEDWPEAMLVTADELRMIVREAIADAAAPTQEADPWEDINTLPNCDDPVWLYCQDTNTIDGPVAPRPHMAEDWTHWCPAEAPSTQAIDTARARQEGGGA